MTKVTTARKLTVLAALAIALAALAVQPGTAMATPQADPGITPNTVEPLSYGASGYRYLVFGGSSPGTPPAGFQLPGFDDSGFSTGGASFGGGGGICGGLVPIMTDWPVNSNLVVRKVVSVPSGATGVRIMIAIDNDILGVWWNGTQITGHNVHGGCASKDHFRFNVPQGLVQPTNVVVYHVLDYGGLTYFDTRILAEKPLADTTPPVVTAPAALTVECNTTGGVLTSDPAIQVWLASASAMDNVDGALPVSNNLAAGLCVVGTTKTVAFSATDAAGNTGSATSTITVVDTTAPSISSASASPNKLWPPNHKLVPVTVSVSASDACDSSVTCSITSVTSNEPVNGLGDGDTAPDWAITGALTVDLRAERSGKGTGRIYTITVTCTDDAGNSSTKTVTVTVPHSQGN